MPILDGISAMKQIKILEQRVNKKHLLLHLLLTQLLVIKEIFTEKKVWMVIYQNLLNLKSFIYFRRVFKEKKKKKKKNNHQKMKLKITLM